MIFWEKSFWCSSLFRTQRHRPRAKSNYSPFKKLYVAGPPRETPVCEDVWLLQLLWPHVPHLWDSGRVCVWFFEEQRLRGVSDGTSSSYLLPAQLRCQGMYVYLFVSVLKQLLLSYVWQFYLIGQWCSPRIDSFRFLKRWSNSVWTNYSHPVLWKGKHIRLFMLDSQILREHIR